MRRVTPFIDDHSIIKGAILTFTDITESTRLRNLLRRAMRAGRMAWWEWNLRTDKLNVYAEKECILGYNPLDLKRDSSFWFDRTHPDDLDLGTL